MKLKTLLVTLILFKVFAINAQSWQPINSPTTQNINACSFVDENKGWIVTTSAIYKTTNGGTSWTTQNFPAAPSNNTRMFTSVHFINDNVGIISCGNYLYTGHNPALVSTILWTNDGGVNWVYKDLGSYNDYDLSAILVTPLIAYSIGQYGQSKRTTDGGATWTDLNFSPNTGYSGKSLFALDANHVFFAGLQNIFLTGAVGKMIGSTWYPTDMPEVTSMNDIFFTNSNNGCVVGYNGVIKVTTDGGNSWTNGTTGITSTLSGVSFKNVQQGWATTYDGKIIKSIDAGNNWTTEYNGTTALNDITFKNGYGYAVGAGGQILKYNSNLQTAQFTKNNFSVYPNPAKDVVNIINANPESRIEKIEIYNAIGQNVKNIENPEGEHLTFTLGNLNSGIYYLKITDDSNAVSTKKLIIKQ